MNWKLFFVTFASIFLAELGDKTQLATISFTADNVKYKWIVFFAAAGALVFTTFIGVFFGHFITKFISPKYIKIIAAVMFLVIGIFLLINSFKEPEIDPKIQRLAEKIKEIQAIEKCRYCKKFNEFISENKIKFENLKGNEMLIEEEKENLHHPLNCSGCNTDYLKGIL